MSPRAPAAIAALCLACGCATGQPVSAPVRSGKPPAPVRPAVSVSAFPLPNADFERPARPGERCPEHWGCKMHADPDSFRFTLDAERPAGGRQSLRIERITPEPWALATQVVQPPALGALKGKRVRVTLAVRVEDAAGNGAGTWVLVHGPGGNLAHEQRLVKGTHDWQRIAVEVDVAASAIMLELGATLDGPGRAWIDDLRLEIL